MAGLFWGSVFAPLIILWTVLARSPDGGNDPSSWAWIDVVSGPTPQGLPYYAGECMSELTPATDLFIFLHQTGHYAGQVCATGVAQLQTAVDGGVEHCSDPAGSSRWCSVPGAGGAGFQFTERLEWDHGQPGEVPAREHHHLLRHDLRRAALCSLSESGGKEFRRWNHATVASGLSQLA